MESTPDNLNPDQADLFFGDPAILPDWQCRFCANYEYARESAGFREAVSNARCQGTKGYHSGFVWALRDFLATNVPEFPDVPWQRIKMIRRTELLSRIEITTEGRPAAIRDFGTPEQYCSGVCSREIFGSLDDDASVVLHIDFSEHDAFLVREFALWLKARRRELTSPDRQDAAYYQPRKNRRGQGRNYRVWTNHLGRLAQYRKLRNRSGQAADRAIFKNPKRERKLVTEVERTIQTFGGMRKIGFVI